MKTKEEIISQALESVGVIKDTRANIILCKKVIELTKQEAQKLFKDAVMKWWYKQEKGDIDEYDVGYVKIYWDDIKELLKVLEVK